MSLTTYHVPVLGSEVVRLAAGRSRGVDATAGGGGHTALLREAGLAVLAIDRDAEAVAALRSRFGDDVAVHHGPFADEGARRRIAEFQPDFVLMDLGVSSHQLDRDERGFSFRPGLPLDMRMGPDAPQTAAEWLRAAPETELAAAFRAHADERRHRALAREIVRRRERHPFTTSDDLVNAIRAVLGSRSGPSDFARLFQAVRITVNREWEQLEAALPDMRDALEPGGMLVVLTYHSGEDRLVKHAFREWARACVCPPRQPVCTCRGRPLGTVLTRRPIRASAAEAERNPRARSVRLRAFEVAA